MTRAGHTAFSVFVLLFFAFSYVHYHSGGANHNTHARLDLLHSVFFDGTMHIDRYHENTVDKAFYEGHYYSSKPPGLVVLAAPGFALSVLMMKALGQDVAEMPGWALVNWMTTILSVGLLAAIGGMTFFLVARRFVSERTALLGTLGAFLGSLPFTYATVFFGHGATVGLLCIALYATLRPSGSTQTRWDALAGFCLGFAVATEYVAVIAATGMVIYACVLNRRRGCTTLLAMMPPLFLIPLYSWLCFGTPWTIGYAHEVRFPDMVKTGIFGIHPPSLSRHLTMLFSPEKGLFFWTPFFFLAIPGFITLWKKNRALFWLTFGVTVVHIAIIGSHRSVLGGQGISARNYTSIVPFIGLASTVGLKRYRRIGIFAVILSIALTGFATVINAFPPENTFSPLIDFQLPQVVKGIYMPSLGSFMGLNGPWSIALLLATLGFFITSLWRDMAKKDKPAKRSLV